MPESRSRSRKRKAAASKRDCRDAEKDAQSQTSCPVPRGEERYVPRFGSSSKRPRTGSCSQPAPRVSERDSEVSEGNTPGEGMPGSKTGSTLLPPSQLESCSTSNSTGCGTVDSDNTAVGNGAGGVELAVQEEGGVCASSLTSPLPLSQSQTTLDADHHPTNPRGDSNNAGLGRIHEPKLDPHNPTPCLSSIHAPAISTLDLHNVTLSPLAPDSQRAAEQQDSAPAADNSNHSEVKDTLLGKNDMNLDLLDPLECNDEEEKEGQDKTELMNVHEPAEADLTDDVINSQADIKHSQAGQLSINVNTLPANSQSATQNSATQVTSGSISMPTPHIPQSISQQEGTFPLPQDVDEVNGHNIRSESYTHQSMYDNSDTRDLRKMSDSACIGEEGCVCEGGYTEEGMEDVVVVGGDSGQLLMANSSQDLTKHQTAVLATASPDELMAVREMMDLTAHDLLESQLLEEATVPSRSPLTLHTSNIAGGRCVGPVAQQESNIPLSKEPSSPAPSGTPTAEGSQLLHGLIEELSALNQLILACKREFDAGRRQRDAWLSSHQPPRGR